MLEKKRPLLYIHPLELCLWNRIFCLFKNKMLNCQQLVPLEQKQGLTKTFEHIYCFLELWTQAWRRWFWGGATRRRIPVTASRLQLHQRSDVIDARYFPVCRAEGFLHQILLLFLDLHHVLLHRILHNELKRRDFKLLLNRKKEGAWKQSLH